MLATVTGEVDGALEGTYKEYASKTTLASDSVSTLGEWQVNADEHTHVRFASELQPILLTITIRNNSLERALSFELSGFLYEAWNGVNLGEMNITRGVTYSIDNAAPVNNALYTSQIVNVEPTKTAVIVISLEITDTGKSVNAFDNSFTMILRNVPNGEGGGENPGGGNFVYNPNNTLSVPSGTTVTPYNLPAELFANANNPDAFYGLYTDSEKTNKVSYPYTATQNTILYAEFGEWPSTVGLTAIGNEYEVFANEGASGDIIIPERYEGLPITNIADYGFAGYGDITSIILPGTVTRIGSYSFADCTGLSGIVIPASVVVIAEGAFSGCTFEVGGTEGMSAKLFGARVFNEPTLSQPVIFEPNSNLTEIGYEAFRQASGLKSIVLPASLEKINDFSFAFSGLEQVDYEPNAKLIDVDISAFEGTQFMEALFMDAVYYNEAADQYLLNGGIVYLGGLAWFILPKEEYATEWYYDDWQGEWYEDGYYYYASQSYDITEGTTRIANSFAQIISEMQMYNGYSGLIQSLHIPASVKIIGENAFKGVFGSVGGGGEGEAWANKTSSAKPKQSTSAFAASSAKGAATFAATTFSQTYTDFVSNLITIGLGSQLTEIRAFAFANNQLGQMFIPASVTTIGEKAFNYSLFDGAEQGGGEIPMSARLLGSQTNSYETTTNSVNFETNSTLQEIGESAFQDSGIVSIAIPDSVKVIGHSAFLYSSLESATIGANSQLEFFGNGVFDATPFSTNQFTNSFQIIYFGPVAYRMDSGYGGQPEDTKVVIAHGTKILGSELFNINTDYWITEIEIPNTVTTISTAAFFGLSNIPSIELPSSVTMVYEKAFMFCYNLNIFVNSDTSMWDVAWNDNGYGEELPYYSNVQSLHSTEKYDYIVHKDNSVSIVKYNGQESEIDFAEFAEYDRVIIGMQAFWYKQMVASVFITPNIKEIGNRAFGYTGLTSIVLPNSLETIGSGLFTACSLLQTAQLPSNLSYIPDYTFSASGLVSITIPESIVSIGEAAFSNSHFLETVIIEGNIKSIGSQAFSGCTALTEFEIPMSVTEIGEQVFSSCNFALTVYTKLNEKPSSWHTAWNFNGYYNYVRTYFGANEYVRVADFDYIIHNNNTVSIVQYKGTDSVVDLTAISFGGYPVTHIGNRAFYSSSVAHITIPASVISIGESAFYSNLSHPSTSKLETVIFEENSNLEIIESSAFHNAIFTSFTLPKSVKTIASSAFKYCYNLISFVIEEGSVLETIGYSAFDSCNQLLYFNIPITVTRIESNAFHTCLKLVLITPLSEKPETWQANWSRYYFNYQWYDLPVVWNAQEVVSTTNYDYIMHNDNLTATILKYKGNDTIFDLSTADFGGKTLVSIAARAFENCATLQQVFIPSSVATIGENAFRYCNSLIIYTSVAQQPEGWVPGWNNYRTVVYGATQLP